MLPAILGAPAVIKGVGTILVSLMALSGASNISKNIENILPDPMVEITEWDQEGGYLRGKYLDYEFGSKTLRNPSPHGINDGRTSKLTIKDKEGQIVVHYDRGWSDPPQTRTEQHVAHEIVKELDRFIGTQVRVNIKYY